MKLKDRVARLEDRLETAEKYINTMQYENRIYQQEPDYRFPYRTTHSSVRQVLVRDVVDKILEHLNMAVTIEPAKGQTVLLQKKKD